MFHSATVSILQIATGSVFIRRYVMEHPKNEMAFPISDTIPGPGNFTATVDFEESEETNSIPTVKTNLPIGHLGHGTAEDMSSTDMTP
jgi:hypothetical protein